MQCVCMYMYVYKCTYTCNRDGDEYNVCLCTCAGVCVRMGAELEIVTQIHVHCMFSEFV